MVLDDQIWKLTFHAQGMASETGPDENCRCALATALLKPPKLEHLKDILAKALELDYVRSHTLDRLSLQTYDPIYPCTRAGA